jgi:hypothetical protein
MECSQLASFAELLATPRSSANTHRRHPAQCKVETFAAERRLAGPSEQDHHMAGLRPSPTQQRAIQQDFRAFINALSFPCVGAKSAVANEKLKIFIGYDSPALGTTCVCRTS